MISLTTHGSRIGKCHLAIESIIRGKERPARLILWMSEKDMQHPLPRSLRGQVKRGVEVRIADNLGPHTKYFPTLAVVEGCSVPLVTADDDILYPRYWLKKLVECHELAAEDIFCYRARVMRFESPERLAPYESWPYASSMNVGEGPLFITGVSGALYPTKMISALNSRGKEFLDRCPKADDIWLSHTAHVNGIRIRIVEERSVDFPTLDSTQAVGLKHSNVGSLGNDRQLRSTYSNIETRQLFSVFESSLRGRIRG